MSKTEVVLLLAWAFATVCLIIELAGEPDNLVERHADEQVGWGPGFIPR
jgi:hypothetical protein